jgi:hypothetical protein
LFFHLYYAPGLSEVALGLRFASAFVLLLLSFVLINYTVIKFQHGDKCTGILP